MSKGRVKRRDAETWMQEVLADSVEEVKSLRRGDGLLIIAVHDAESREFCRSQGIDPDAPEFRRTQQQGGTSSVLFNSPGVALAQLAAEYNTDAADVIYEKIAVGKTPILCRSTGGYWLATGVRLVSLGKGGL